jgi:hypothetical protein
VAEFREKFLSLLFEKGDSTIDEWRNTEGIDLKDINKRDGYHNPEIMRMFDWKNYCYDWIPHNQQEQSIHILQRLLSTEKWKITI